MTDPDLVNRAIRYAALQSGTMTKSLGFGTDGGVWSTDRSTAIKVFSRTKNYAIELESYRRLQEAGITDLIGFTVPELFGWDDELLVIEMSLVKPPMSWTSGKSISTGRPIFLRTS